MSQAIGGGLRAACCAGTGRIIAHWSGRRAHETGRAPSGTEDRRERRARSWTAGDVNLTRAAAVFQYPDAVDVPSAVGPLRIGHFDAHADFALVSFAGAEEQGAATDDDPVRVNLVERPEDDAVRDHQDSECST